VIKLGYKLMSKEHGPTDLVRNARAEDAGFDFAVVGPLPILYPAIRRWLAGARCNSTN
jgi:hypothetical protein